MQVSMDILNIQCYVMGYLLSSVIIIVVILFGSFVVDLDSVLFKMCILCLCFYVAIVSHLYQIRLLKFIAI